MRTSAAFFRPRPKRGCIVCLTYELTGVLTTLNIIKDDKALEWVLKSLCLADMGLLEHWDDIHCEVFQKHSQDLLYCKLTSIKQLDEFFDVPEGGEYPVRFFGAGK